MFTGTNISEYGMGLEVSTEGDAYSFGILLLEMFTGRRPTEDMFMDGLSLHNYVKIALPEQVWKIVDASLLPREIEENKEVQAAAGDEETSNSKRLVKKNREICQMKQPLERANALFRSLKLH